MKTVLVTGATRQVGRAAAVAFAQAGWRVYALGRARHVLEDLRASYGIEPLCGDLTDRGELRALLCDLPLDAVVHAALRWPEGAEFAQLKEGELDMGVEVNLSAPLHLTQIVLPGMCATGHGAMLFVDDANPAPLARAVAGAQDAFAQALSAQTETQGVRVGYLSLPDANGAAAVTALDSLLNSEPVPGHPPLQH